MWAGSQAPQGLIGAAEELFGAADFDPPNLKFFPQSVASGDPAPEGVVLWTRALPAPKDRGGSVRVGYRIALDDERSDTDAFLSPVLSGVAQTGRGRDFTVKVQVQDAKLRPGTKYRYRFYVDGKRSRSGRFKTLPEPGADVAGARFGYISCQDYTNGYYTALYHLEREEDLDFIVHLGDYIYETVAEDNFQGGGPEERQIDPASLGSATNGEGDTLADYRFLYKKYKTDPNLQALHEKYAFITIWDDHEFANDAYRSFAPDSADSPREADTARRSAANRAWTEFTPDGAPHNASKGPLDEIRIYRTFDVGNLMTLVLADERLYRDGPPCGFDTFSRVITPGCGEEELEGRTMLGDRQKDWFLNKITGSTRRWKVWGNETMFMQFKMANTYLAGGEQQIFPGVPQGHRRRRHRRRLREPRPVGRLPGRAGGDHPGLPRRQRRAGGRELRRHNRRHPLLYRRLRPRELRRPDAARLRDGGRRGPEPEQQASRDVLRVRLGDLVEPGGARRGGRQRGLPAGRREVPRIGGRAERPPDRVSGGQQPAHRVLQLLHPRLQRHGGHAGEAYLHHVRRRDHAAAPAERPAQKSVLARFEIPNGLVQLQRTDIVPKP